MLENSVFKRTEADGAIISDNLYNFVIGLTLLWGFGVNYLMVRFIDPSLLMSVPYPVFLIGYFILCFAGIMIFNKSDVPLISFLGYNLVVIPFGLIINLIVHQYDPRLVMDAMFVTGIVTLVMMFLGTMFPAFFQKIGRALSVALITTIIVELVLWFVFKKDPVIIDWIVVVIFCGYIGFDWGRANQIPKTVDNAIDSAASLYMDIINLFIRILRIMGRRR